MRFRFRLQPVLELAARDERTVLRALAAAAAEAQSRSREIDELDARARGAAAQAAWDPSVWMHLDRLSGVRRAQRERLSEAMTELERLRSRLSEVARQRRALEILRDRRLAEFEVARDRAEQREIDESNAARAPSAPWEPRQIEPKVVGGPSPATYGE